MVHYLITNREVLVDNAGQEYIREDGLDTAGEKTECLRFALFDSTKYKKTGSCKYAVTLLPALPVIEKEFSSRVKKEGDLLCYIHGFHTDFRGVLEDICALEEKYIHGDSPIEYIVGLTWPARENYLAYDDDAKDAELSGYTFAQSYSQLADFFKTVAGTSVCNIHLLAHSMGNRMLQHMLLHLSTKKDFKFIPMFKEVVLAAADIDWDGFEEEYAFSKLQLLCERITVYYHSHDRALFLSERIENKKRRLGRHGFRDYEKIAGNVYSIDCSSIPDEDNFIGSLIGHTYHKNSSATIKDIIWVLKGKEVNSFIEESLRTNKSNSQRDFILNISM